MDRVDEASGTAIAAFTLAQLAFWNQIQFGELSIDKAAEMLQQGITANTLGGPANQKAAEMLQMVLDVVTEGQNPRPN